MASEHILEPLDYLYEELPPERMAAVRKHLAECPRCRRDMRGIRETVKAYRLAVPPAPPAGLAERTAVLALSGAREGKGSPSVATVARPITASRPQSTVGNSTADVPLADHFTAAGFAPALPASALSAPAFPVPVCGETAAVDPNAPAKISPTAGSVPTVPVAFTLAAAPVTPVTQAADAGIDCSRDHSIPVATVAASSSSDATSAIFTPAGTPALNPIRRTGNISQEEMEEEFARFKAEVMREIPRGWRSWLYHPAWTVAASVIFLCSLLMHLSPRMQARPETHYLAAAPARDSHAARQLRDRERLPAPVPTPDPGEIPQPPPGPQTALLEAEALNDPPPLLPASTAGSIAVSPKNITAAEAKVAENKADPDPDPTVTAVAAAPVPQPPSPAVAAKTPSEDPPYAKAGGAVAYNQSIAADPASPPSPTSTLRSTANPPQPADPLAASDIDPPAAPDPATPPSLSPEYDSTYSAAYAPNQSSVDSVPVPGLDAGLDEIGSFDADLAQAIERFARSGDRDLHETRRREQPAPAAGQTDSGLPASPLGSLPSGTDNFAMAQSADDLAVYPPARMATRPGPASSSRLPREMPVVAIPPLESGKPIEKAKTAAPDLADGSLETSPSPPTARPDPGFAVPTRPSRTKERLGYRSRSQVVNPVVPVDRPLTETSAAPAGSDVNSALVEVPAKQTDTPASRRQNPDPASAPVPEPAAVPETPGVIIMNLDQPEEPPQIVPRPTPISVQQSVNSLIGLIGMQIANREWEDAWKTVGMLSYYDEQAAKQMIAMLTEAQLADKKETAEEPDPDLAPLQTLRPNRGETEPDPAAPATTAVPPAATGPSTGSAPGPTGVRVVPIDPDPTPEPEAIGNPATDTPEPGVTPSSGAAPAEALPSYAAYLVDYVEPLENPPLSVILVPGPPPAGLSPPPPGPTAAPPQPPAYPPVGTAFPPANIWAPPIPPQPPIPKAAPAPSLDQSFLPQTVASPRGDAAVSPLGDFLPAPSFTHSRAGIPGGDSQYTPARVPDNTAGKAYILREDPFEQPAVTGSVLVPAADPAAVSTGPARVTALAETALIPAEQALSAFPMLTESLPDAPGRPVYVKEDPVVMNPVYLTEPGAAALTTTQFHSYPLRQLVRKRMIAEQDPTD